MSGRTERLQARIDAALRETPEETSRTRFSPYLHRSDDLGEQLMQAARDGGIEAALDVFDRLRDSEDPGRLRHALITFLVDFPEVYQSGLRVPSLLERAPWMVAPSNRKP